MIPRAEQVGEGGGGGQAGGEGDGVLRAVDGGQALLEDVAGGVAAAAVLESIGERLLVHYEVILIEACEGNCLTVWFSLREFISFCKKKLYILFLRKVYLLRPVRSSLTV